METHRFYLFETFVKNVYKFGYTSKTIQQRFYGYSGLAKPKKMIGTLECQDGVVTEAKFRLFLDKYKIKIVTDIGNEYFEFEGGIQILFEHFRKLYDFTELDRKVRSSKTQPMTNQELTDAIIKWFFKNYHETDKTEKKYTQMRDVYRNFKYSDIYRRLSTKQKYSMTRHNFEMHILSNLRIRKYHKFVLSFKINGKSKYVRNVLVNIEMNNQ